MNTANPFGRPLYVMVKSVGAACNLSCKYCYYLEKKNLYDKKSLSSFDDTLLETFIRQYIEAQTQPEVLFIWHGGEPLLRPISFYQRALELQRKYGRDRQIDNCLQTNGTLLNDEWCEFFKKNNFLIGISIDGPQHLHDRYRTTVSGAATWHDVMRGIRLLQRHEIEWNALAVVNNVNANYPKEVYRFFREIGCRHIQFTPVVERHIERADALRLSPGMTAWASEWQTSGVTDFSVTPVLWGKFLCEVYDEWVTHDVGNIFIQLFDATLANWAGLPPGVCTMSTYCGHAAMLECDGTVYACDHFAYPEYRLGNIRQQSITELMYGDRQKQFGRTKHDALPLQCRQCKFLFACNGECPKNRFLIDAYGEKGLNYLCQGYYSFFEHVEDDMYFMLNEWENGRPPANIMNMRRVERKFNGYR